MTPLSIFFAIAAVYILTYLGKAYGAVVTAAGFLFYAWYNAGPSDPAFFELCLWVAMAVAIVFGVNFVRNPIITDIIFR